MSQNEYYYLGRLKSLEITASPNSSYFGFSNLNPIFNDLFSLFSSLINFKFSYLIFIFLISFFYARFFKNLSHLLEINKIYFFIFLPIFFILQKLNYADIYLTNFEITPNDIAWALFFNFLIDFYRKDTFKSAILFASMFSINPSIFIFAVPIFLFYLYQFQVKEIIKFIFISFLLSFEQIIFILFNRKNIDPILYSFNQKASSYYYFINKPHHYAPFGSDSTNSVWPDLYLKLFIILSIAIWLNYNFRKQSEFLTYLLMILNLQVFLQTLFFGLSYFELTKLHLLIFPFKGIIIITLLIFIFLVKELALRGNLNNFFVFTLISCIYFFIDYFPYEQFKINFFWIVFLFIFTQLFNNKYLPLLLIGILLFVSIITIQKIGFEKNIYEQTDSSYNFLKNSNADLILVPNEKVNLFWSSEFEIEKPVFFIKKFIPHDFKHIPEWQIRYEINGRFYNGECTVLESSNIYFISFEAKHPCGDLVFNDNEIYVYKKVK